MKLRSTNDDKRIKPNNGSKTKMSSFKLQLLKGNVIALFHTLKTTWTVHHLLIVSPQYRGSNPYPRGSLTYRINIINYIYYIP